MWLFVEKQLLDALELSVVSLDHDSLLYLLVETRVATARPSASRPDKDYCN